MLLGDDMRKGIVYLGLFFLCFSNPIESKNQDLRFVIVFDSHENNKIQVKKEILNLINEVTESIHANNVEYYLKNISNELNEKNRQVEFENHTLYFYLGDQKGMKVEGNLLKCSYCMIEVKPKSFFRRLFGF